MVPLQLVEPRHQALRHPATLRRVNRPSPTFFRLTTQDADGGAFCILARSQ